MTQNSCTMHRHQTYIKSLQNEQSTSILCTIDGKLITVWVSHISVLSYHGDDALCYCSQGGIDSSAGVVQCDQINQKLYDINTDLLTVVDIVKKCSCACPIFPG